MKTDLKTLVDAAEEKPEGPHVEYVFSNGKRFYRAPEDEAITHEEDEL